MLTAPIVVQTARDLESIDPDPVFNFDFENFLIRRGPPLFVVEDDRGRGEGGVGFDAEGPALDVVAHLEDDPVGAGGDGDASIAASALGDGVGEAAEAASSRFGGSGEVPDDPVETGGLRGPEFLEGLSGGVDDC